MRCYHHVNISNFGKNITLNVITENEGQNEKVMVETTSMNKKQKKFHPLTFQPSNNKIAKYRIRQRLQCNALRMITKGRVKLSDLD